MPVEDPRKETAALYKTSGLKIVKDAEDEETRRAAVSWPATAHRGPDD